MTEQPIEARGKNPIQSALFWAPRILGGLFAVFISLFALDIFGMGYSVWKTALALGIHLIPTAVLLAALTLSWRWEWLGGILFPGLGILYLVTTRGLHWSAYAVISGPLFLAGILFLVSWQYQRVLQRNASTGSS